MQTAACILFVQNHRSIFLVLAFLINFLPAVAHSRCAPHPPCPEGTTSWCCDTPNSDPPLCDYPVPGHPGCYQIPPTPVPTPPNCYSKCAGEECGCETPIPTPTIEITIPPTIAPTVPPTIEPKLTPTPPPTVTPVITIRPTISPTRECKTCMPLQQVFGGLIFSAGINTAFWQPEGKILVIDFYKRNSSVLRPGWVEVDLLYFSDPNICLIKMCK